MILLDASSHAQQPADGADLGLAGGLLAALLYVISVDGLGSITAFILL